MVTSDTWIKFLYKLDNDVQCALKYIGAVKYYVVRDHNHNREIMEKLFFAEIVRKPSSLNTQ